MSNRVCLSKFTIFNQFQGSSGNIQLNQAGRLHGMFIDLHRIAAFQILQIDTPVPLITRKYGSDFILQGIPGHADAVSMTETVTDNHAVWSELWNWYIIQLIQSKGSKIQISWKISEYLIQFRLGQSVPV